MRPDQAATAIWILTSAGGAEILIGPAGYGKSTTIAEIARMRRHARSG